LWGRKDTNWSLIYFECCKRNPSVARLQSAPQKDNKEICGLECFLRSWVVPSCSGNYIFMEHRYSFLSFSVAHRRAGLIISATKPTPIPVTAPSKLWVCGSSLSGIAGSNSAGGMDVCLL
jgi:hypothetical protein